MSLPAAAITTALQCPPPATPPSNNDTTSTTNAQHNNRRQRRSRGLSLSLTGTSLAQTKATSTLPLPSPPKTAQLSELSIQFNGEQQLVLRPGRVIRGSVILHAACPIHASQIRIKLRAEEVATAKVREKTYLPNKCDVHQVTTVHFEVDSKVWGHETSAFLLNTWQTLEPGTHEFPFALKFCNVNFPPSLDEPAGFAMQYLWTAHVDGAGFQPGLRSKQYITPFRPILCAPIPMPWTLDEWLCKSDTAYARVRATLCQQVFCPDDWVDILVEISCLRSDMVVSGVGYTLKKHCDGKLRLQQGTAYRSAECTIMQQQEGGVCVPGNEGTVQVPVRFQLPTRGVSPSFTSRHIRVYYSLVLHIQCDEGTSTSRLLLKKTSHHKADVAVPLAIANLQHDQMLRVSNLTAIQPYHTSDEVPMFFDPSLNEPPPTPLLTADGTNAAWQHSATPPLQSPPNYFSLPTLPPQLRRQKRVVRSIQTSRCIQPGAESELGAAVDIISVFDDEW